MKGKYIAPLVALTVVSLAGCGGHKPQPADYTKEQAVLALTNLMRKDITDFEYEVREMMLHNQTFEQMKNSYRHYDATIHSNGFKAFTTFYNVSSTTFLDEKDVKSIIAEGDFVSYSYDENYYVLAQEVNRPTDLGFAILYEKNPFYDERSEDLGIYSFIAEIALNFLGEYSTWPTDYGYNEPEFSAFYNEDGDIEFTMSVTCDSVDYGDWIIPAEDNYFRITVDEESGNVIGLDYQTCCFHSTPDTQPVNITQLRFSNIETGTLVAGTFDEVDTTNMDPDLVELTLPQIQEDIEVDGDGNISTDSAIAILDNIWAYAANTVSATATGPATSYDPETYEDISGTQTLTFNAYADNIVIKESTFTPDDTTTYEAFTRVTQKYVTAAGIAEVNILDGEYEYGSVNSYFDASYTFSRQFSASPLMQDWILGTIINEAIRNKLTSSPESAEYKLYYQNVSHTKEGNTIKISWETKSEYDETFTRYELTIVDDFLTTISFGDVGGTLTTYTCTQGEYPEFTGTLIEVQEEEY